MPDFLDIAEGGATLADKALKTYISIQDIKRMKEEQKRLQKELDVGIEQKKIENKTEADKLHFGIAQQIYKMQHPEKFESGFEAEARVRAERLKEGLPGYMSAKKVDITGMPQSKKGGAAGGSVSPYVSMLNAADSELNSIQNELASQYNLAGDNRYQIVANGVDHLLEAVDETDLETKYSEALAILPKDDKEGIQVFVNKLNKAKLAMGKRLKASQAIWQEDQNPTAPPAKSKAQSWEAESFRNAIDTGDRDTLNKWINEFRRRGMTDEEIEGL